MTAKVAMPVRDSDLVVPLAHEATAMRAKETAGSSPAGSCAVSGLIGESLRLGDVDSTNGRSTRATTVTPGPSTSATATRTTTTRTTSSGSGSSADEIAFHADISIQDVVAAHLDCRRHKRNTAACQEFERDLAANLWALYEALRARTWRPGRSICFIEHWPKDREVWAAPYPDRVVHHLFHIAVAQRFERSFIANSSACIPGRGTAYAARRLERDIRSCTQNWKAHGYYLKCDIASFFVSIHKPTLKAELHHKIHEPFWRWLADTILMHDPREDVEVHATPAELAAIPRHKSLFAQDLEHGLPIGNLPSQVFANIYLNVLDQHVKHDLHARYYGRYVDDFYILDRSAEYLNYCLADIDAFLPARLGCRLHPKKTIIQPIDRGVDFVGQVVKPWRRTWRKKTRDKALHRLATMPATEVYESANSYFGVARQASHSHRDRAALARVMLDLGHAVNRQFTKVERKTT